MNLLTDKYYEGVVVSDEVDPYHAGAVRVRIIGITDDLKPNQQPWAIPSIQNHSGVPTKGTVLEISFDEGDINKPKYFNFSTEKSYLPAAYVQNYPHVTVVNLGGDFFKMFHDRNSKNTLITHPSNSVIAWDNFGTVIHDSDNGYENSGQGAKEQTGQKIHPVLTEGTIDIFCCTPVGFGDAHQGSEYLKVTHISKSTVDLINGIAGSSEGDTDEDPLTPTGVDTSILNPLLDSNGNVSTEVTFIKTSSFIEAKAKRKPTHILIATSGTDDFIDISKNILDKNNQISSHYVIGKEATASASDSEGNPDINRSNGFIQFIDIKNDSYLGSKIPSPKEPNLFPSVKANKNAISIILIGTVAGEILRTTYQQKTINIILEHVKKTYNLKSSDLIVTDIGMMS